jgi:hypothetical protein
VVQSRQQVIRNKEKGIKNKLLLRTYSFFLIPFQRIPGGFYKKIKNQEIISTLFS